MKRSESLARVVSFPKILGSSYLRIGLLAALGIAFILFGTFYARDKAPSVVTTDSGSLASHEQAIAAMVEEVLGAVKGVGKVRVKVTAEMGPQSVYASNTTKSSTSSVETTPGGEIRENTSENESSQPVTGRFGTSEEPLVERVLPVKIGGCLVVAEGATSSRVKQNIYEAVSTLLNIPVYKIVVEPMQGGK